MNDKFYKLPDGYPYHCTWEGEPNDGSTITDQDPGMSVEEMVNAYVETGELPGDNGGYYDDPNIPDDELVPNPISVDLSDVHSAYITIENAQAEVAKKRRASRKKANEPSENAEPAELSSPESEPEEASEPSESDSQ